MADNRIRFSNNFVLKDNKVGINTVDPQALLDVGGELRVSGVSTFTSNVDIETLSVDGVSSLSSADITNLVVSGISSLGFTTTTGLYATGVSTFSGIVTTTSDVYVGGDLYVQDDLVFDSFVANNFSIVDDANIGGQLNISGISSEAAYTAISTSNAENQVIDEFEFNSYINANYKVSVACTGQLNGSYESPSKVSIQSITSGQGYIPGIYYNVPLKTQSGSGSGAKANIIVGGNTGLVGFTSAYNVLVTTTSTGIGANTPISFGSSIARAEYPTLVENNIFYTPVPHGIGKSEAVSFASSIFDSSYSGIAVTVGNTYYATGTGNTSFTIQYSIGGSQVIGIGTTSFAFPGNRVSLPGVAVTAGNIYYATGTGTTTFTIAEENTGLGTVTGIRITSGVNNILLISGGVTSIEIVYPGSGYSVGAALSSPYMSTNGTITGYGFSCSVSNVYTNYQTTEINIITGEDELGISTCKYTEVNHLSNKDLLGNFDAVSIGSTAQLRFSPRYNNSNIKIIRKGIVK